MPNAPFFLPVGCFAIIVKRDAVVRSFPEGASGFEAAYKPPRSDEKLYLLIAFSEDALGALVIGLEQAGIVARMDFAVTDPLRRPVMECRNILIYEDPDSLQVSAHLLEEPQPFQLLLLHLQEPGDWNVPIPIDNRGCILKALRGPDDWLAIDRAEQGGAVDDWDVFLVARRGHWGFMLEVVRYAWLGEMPDDWSDGEGELTSEHRDATGDLILPQEWYGRRVLGAAYGGFIGGLEASFGGDAVQISDGSDELVRAALQALRWEWDAVAKVQAALQQLAETVESVSGDANDV